MDYTCRIRTLSSLVKEINNGKYFFESELQRQEGQWNKKQISELIDSILRNYPIDPIRTIKRDNGTLDVIDGKQRSLNIRNFINDEIVLAKGLKPVTVDGEIFEISGRKYSALNEVLKDRIDNYEIQVYIFSDCTEEDVREMFLRQNNGKALSNVQKRPALSSNEMNYLVTSILKHDVFSKMLSKSQFVNDNSKDLVRQTLMLMTYDENELTSFSSVDINKFIMSNPDIDDGDVNCLLLGLTKLDEYFNSEIKLNKLTIPMVLYCLYYCIKYNKDLNKFLNWLENDFIMNYDINIEYKKHCVNNTSNHENVMGRYRYFKNRITNL